MTGTTTKVREHYSSTGLTDRIKSALATVAPEGQRLTVDQLAPLDQFHTRGILATAELATAAGLNPSTRVLDLGCGWAELLLRRRGTRLGWRGRGPGSAAARAGIRSASP